MRRLGEDSQHAADGKSVRMTLRIDGVCAPPASAIHQCIGRADEQLYQARNSGRNRVVFEREAS